jgi:hypothetical protein
MRLSVCKERGVDNETTTLSMELYMHMGTFSGITILLCIVRVLMEIPSSPGLLP